MPHPHLLALNRNRHHRQANVREAHALANNLAAKTLAGIELQLLTGAVPGRGAEHPAQAKTLILGHQGAVTQTQLADRPAQIVGGAGGQAHRGRE